MEVHHHPNVEKKSFKEYLLEGLMIFLAVTMGFIAESLREHISEKRIEKEYIASFVADLQQDTANFNRIIPIEEQSTKGLDTMLQLLNATQYTDSTTRMLYYLYRRYSMSIESLRYTQRTITQLKNSGGLRLITSKQASDSIIAYNKTADDNIDLANITTRDIMIPAIRLGNKIFNATFLLPYNNGNAAAHILKSTVPMPLLTTDASVLKEYQGMIYEERQIRVNYLSQLQWHRQRADDMIAFLNRYIIYTTNKI